MCPEIRENISNNESTGSSGIPEEQYNGTAGIHCSLRIRLQKDSSFWGIGIAQLLHGIERTHSLRAAARIMNIFYSKAWKILRHAEQELGFPLLNSSTGGQDGGGSELTSSAVKLLFVYDEMVRETEKTMKRCFREKVIPMLYESVYMDREIPEGTPAEKETT